MNTHLMLSLIILNVFAFIAINAGSVKKQHNGKTLEKSHSLAARPNENKEENRKLTKTYSDPRFDREFRKENAKPSKKVEGNNNFVTGILGPTIKKNFANMLPKIKNKKSGKNKENGDPNVVDEKNEKEEKIWETIKETSAFNNEPSARLPLEDMKDLFKPKKGLDQNTVMAVKSYRQILKDRKNGILDGTVILAKKNDHQQKGMDGDKKNEGTTKIDDDHRGEEENINFKEDAAIIHSAYSSAQTTFGSNSVEKQH